MRMLFEVLVPESSWTDGQIVAQHKWGLPGLKCVSCGETWGQPGLQYPSVDLSAWSREVEYRQLWPVSAEEFESRRSALEPLVPKGVPLLPGTQFGPLVGEVRGDFGDFAWRDGWTLLARPRVITQLSEAGVKLPKTTRAILENHGSNIWELDELEIEPRALMDPSAFATSLPKCSTCGHIEWEIPEHIIVQESSIPSDVDIFRERVATTLILATERFVDAVKQLELSGLEFNQVETA